MARKSFDVLFFLVLCIGCHGEVDLSKYLTTCDRDSPDLNDCLVDAIQEGIISLSNGIAELDFPPIDPHRQNEVRVEYKNNQIFAKVYLKNIKTTGLKEAKVHDVRAKLDDERFQLEVDVTCPRLLIVGEYRGQGRYNALNVDSNGHFNCSMQDLKYTWKLGGKPEVRDGETYVRITSFNMRPDVGQMQVYADNIFPDNPELTTLANSVSNQNWKIIYQELLPHAQANWAKTGIKVANKLFLKVPYNKLFPSSSA